MWRPSRCLTQYFDDNQRHTTVTTDKGRGVAFLFLDERCFLNSFGDFTFPKALPDLLYILFALMIREQAEVTNTMKARRQDMHQEATNELIDRECHGLESPFSFYPVILPLEGDRMLIIIDV